MSLLWWQQPEATPAPESIAEVFAHMRVNALAALDGIILGIIVFLIFVLAAMIGRRFIALTAPRVRADTGAVLLLSRVYYYGILIFGLLTALPLTGLQINALLAGLGLTGFALGFALKDVLSNLVSGVMLLIYRPFNIGDQIIMGNFEGTIDTIRMRDTVLRSYDGRLIVIPNTKLITEVVINNRRARLTREAVEVALNGDVGATGAAREILVRALEAHEALKGRVEPNVSFERMPDGAARLKGYYWHDPRRADRVTVKEEVARTVERAFAAAGIQILKIETRSAPENLGEKEREEEENDSGEVSLSPEPKEYPEQRGE